MTQARWLRPVIPAGASAVLTLLLAMWLTAGPQAAAQENTIRIDPSGIEVAPGGSFEISIIDDPPPQSATAWVIDLRYDPDVLSVGDNACTGTSFPGGMIGIGQCEVVDSDEDGVDDSVRNLGLGIRTSTPVGFTEEFTIASIVFDVIGDPGDCSDLELVIAVHAGADGEETGALVQDGRACIESDAPTGGTATANPVTPRTSAPTTTPSNGVLTIGPGGTDEPGGTVGGQDGDDDDDTPRPTPTREVVTIDASGRPVTATPGPDEDPTPSEGGLPGIESEDGDGLGAIVWVGLGILVLGAAAAGAWVLIRRGSPETPLGGPPNPPA